MNFFSARAARCTPGTGEPVVRRYPDCETVCGGASFGTTRRDHTPWPYAL